MDHIELLHHFCTVTYKTLTPDCSQQEMWQTTAIKLGISFPFLMHEILAIAALHLAHGRAEEQSHYYTKATELQNHALAGFNAVRRNVGPSNGAAILLFTSLLALHVIADPSRSTGLDPSDYINHFLGCISLMRGVRHVISGDAWVYIKESELKPLLLAPDPPELYDIPEECRALVRLSDDIEPGSTSSRAYNTAIERLHWSFARTNVSEPLPTLRWAMAWLALLKDDYLELLSQRQPQALIILAYYGVLLHFTRNCWPLCNSGAYLVKAINALMGPQLGQWMAWPIKMIASNGEERQDQGDE